MCVYINTYVHNSILTFKGRHTPSEQTRVIDRKPFKVEDPICGLVSYMLEHMKNSPAPHPKKLCLGIRKKHHRISGSGVGLWALPDSPHARPLFIHYLIKSWLSFQVLSVVTVVLKAVVVISCSLVPPHTAATIQHKIEKEPG